MAGKYFAQLNTLFYVFHGNALLLNVKLVQW